MPDHSSVMQALLPFGGLALAGLLVGSSVAATLKDVIFDGSSSSVRSRRRAHQHHGEDEEKKPRKDLWSGILMFARPAAACAAIVSTIMYPEKLQTCGLFPALLKDYVATSVTKALPSLFVSSLTEAYSFGSLAQQAVTAIASSAGVVPSSSIGLISPNGEAPSYIASFLSKWATNATDVPAPTRSQIESLLAEASKIVSGGRSVTLAELLNTHRLIVSQDGQVSLTQRLLGAFTVTNTLYLISILGMTAFLAPFVATLCHQLGLMSILTAILELLKKLYSKVLYPLYVKLTPVVETAFYYCAVLAFVEGTRYAAANDRFGMGGVFSAVTGTCIFGLSWVYSLNLRRSVPPTAAVERFIKTITLSFFTTILTAGAISHGSTLLGYGAVMAFLMQNGFFAAAYPLCTIVGFESEDSLVRTAQSCVSLMCCFLLHRIALINGPSVGTADGSLNEKMHNAVKPFESAVSVLGATGYMLALDILVGIRYQNPKAHVLFIGSSFALTAAGRVLGLPGLANTATVFWVLYGFTMYGTLMRPRSKELIVVWVFMAFALLFGLSRYLTNNPEVLVNGLLMGTRSE